MNDIVNSVVNAKTSEGEAFPLGATLDSDGCNFAVYSPDSRVVILCFFHPDTEETLAEYIMQGKSGYYWHTYVHGIKAGQLYGYRVEHEHHQFFNIETEKLLIDPYAKKLSRAMVWNERQYQGDSQFMIAKSVVIDESSYKRERPPRPKIEKSKRIIYEAHVKGLTKLHPDVPEHHQGKYLGAAHPSVINHLVELGITSVQFMPISSFMPEPYITGKGMTNYWGYNPINFFSPESRYANSDAVEECISMVDAYHEAGLEVILDVVFNHTAEGGKGGTIISFKGLTPYRAYLREQAPDGSLVYSNHSGCGNTFHSAQPIMTAMIMDAMRHWVEFIGVDGFRFDLAPCLGRDPQHFNMNSGLLRAIEQDPVLRTRVKVAEPWDIGPGGYQLGAFPLSWLECNDKYRDTVRAYWRGDLGITADFATRIMGSRDVFQKKRRHPNTSVNNITYHDGFTLQDLVSYEQRHNLANGEDNRDGHGHNLSRNYGVEGETSDEKINALRERQKRNLFTTLVLSQGTPHILGGDELSRTQQGNNNAYCQDNEINWFDWTLNKRKQDFLNFCQSVIKIRQKSKLLSNLLLKDDGYVLNPNVANIFWYKPDGTYKASEDWQSHANQAFGLEIRGVVDESRKKEHWLLCFNSGESDVRFNVPALSPRGGWKLILDTRYATLNDQPKVCIQRVFMQRAMSVAIFHYHEL